MTLTLLARKANTTLATRQPVVQSLPRRIISSRDTRGCGDREKKPDDARGEEGVFSVRGASGGRFFSVSLRAGETTQGWWATRESFVASFATNGKKKQKQTSLSFVCVSRACLDNRLVTYFNTPPYKTQTHTRTRLPHSTGAQLRSTVPVARFGAVSGVGRSRASVGWRCQVE